MGQINTREIVVLGSTTATTNGTGPDINAIQAWQAAIVTLTVTAASGTSPTLSMIVQNKLGQPAAADTSGIMPTGTAIYDDYLAFTAVTTTGSRIMRVVTGPLVSSANATVVTTADYLNLTATLTAGTVRVGPIGGQWRANFVIAGTSPSFTFSVTAQLIPHST
jgi:hypothetical protein